MGHLAHLLLASWLVVNDSLLTVEGNREESTNILTHTLPVVPQFVPFWEQELSP